MSLENLITEFRASDDEIRKIITTGTNEHKLQSLDQQSGDSLYKIREYKPQGFDELKDKFRFFVGRLKADIENVSDVFAVDSLIHMLEKDFSYSMTSLNTRISDDGTITSEENKFKLVNAYDLVSKSHDRISIIDQNFRYVNTSTRNGAFYGEKSHSIIGKHVGDMIGEKRFESRAKNFFTNCFSGRKQDYFHSLEIDGGTRIMSCQMMPLYSGEASVFGSMVAINDVTDMITDPSSILLQEIS